MLNTCIAGKTVLMKVLLIKDSRVVAKTMRLLI